LLANSAASALFTASSSLSAASNSLSDVTGLNDSQVGDYFYAPVKLNRTAEFDTTSYGSQVTPFYLVLSMWVGALITCVMINTGTSIGTKYKPHEMYFGKLLLFNIMAILQTTVSLLGAFGLGIDIKNPLLFVLSCYFVAMIFMAFIYSLISVFGDVGKGFSNYPIGIPNFRFWRYLSC
jgi:Predicted membrane protein